jgi:hypothetical protein
LSGQARKLIVNGAASREIQAKIFLFFSRGARLAAPGASNLGGLGRLGGRVHAGTALAVRCAAE